MKYYQGPAYQKRNVNYDNRRFNRESQSPSSKGAPYKFKSALEEKQETTRGHRPVYHHEQPWRDQPQKMIDASQTPPPASTQEPLEEADYRVAYRERRNSSPNQRFNSDLVRERMMSEPIEEESPAPSYRPGEELRLPQTHSDHLDRAYVAPAERRPQNDWPKLGQASSRQQDRQGLDEFLEAPTSQRSRQAWQASAQRERDHHEASSQRQVSDAQAKFQSILENGRDSQEVARQARAERFQPKELPKPYQPPQSQAVTEVGVSREILARMRKDKDSYLLFED